MGVFNRVTNLEHFRIAGALESFEPSGDCDLHFEAERPLLYLGGARLYEVKLDQGDRSQSTKVSVYFEPTRITNNAESFYHYEWSEANEEDEVEWSYLDLKMDWGGKIEWLEVGRCDSPAEQHYLTYEHKACSGEINAVRCT
jgi:hypothetical protein